MISALWITHSEVLRKERGLGNLATIVAGYLPSEAVLDCILVV